MFEIVLTATITFFILILGIFAFIFAIFLWVFSRPEPKTLRKNYYI